MSVLSVAVLARWWSELKVDATMLTGQVSTCHREVVLNKCSWDYSLIGLQVSGDFLLITFTFWSDDGAKGIVQGSLTWEEQKWPFQSFILGLDVSH